MPIYHQGLSGDWKGFSTALASSLVGQRVIAASSSNCFAAFNAALAGQNPDVANAASSMCSTHYEFTADEKAEFNALVDQYQPEGINHLE